jgi:hypothetical protein
MSSDFYSNMIDGFVKGMSLGSENYKNFAIRNEKDKKITDVIALFDELQNSLTDINSGALGGGAPSAKKEALLATLAPGVFSIYKSKKDANRRTLNYDEPYIYYTDKDGNRTTLDNGSGEKVKNDFYKPKIIDKYKELNNGKYRRVLLYEDGTKEYFDLGEAPKPTKNKTIKERIEEDDPIFDLTGLSEGAKTISQNFKAFKKRAGKLISETPKSKYGTEGKKLLMSGNYYLSTLNEMLKGAGINLNEFDINDEESFNKLLEEKYKLGKISPDNFYLLLLRSKMKGIGDELRSR